MQISHTPSERGFQPQTRLKLFKPSKPQPQLNPASDIGENVLIEAFIWEVSFQPFQNRPCISLASPINCVPRTCYIPSLKCINGAQND